MKSAFRLAPVAAAALVLAVSACAAAPAPAPAPTKDTCGRASWYALTSRTASGERMDPSKLTAAHRNLSFGTKVRVTNARTGKSVTVRINDRGPFIKGRVIDVSKAAAQHLGMVNAGVAKVCYSVVS